MAYPVETMTDDEKVRRKTEQTPKGLTVPVPARETFFDNLKKVAKPQAPPRPPVQSRRPPPSHGSGRGR
jgi:hypothetical protein